MKYHILPCIMCSHAFVCIIHEIIMPMVVHSYGMTIIPMYNEHPYVSLQNLTKQCALYTAKCGNPSLKFIFFLSMPVTELNTCLSSLFYF